jgi:hypothetical protein
MTSSISVIYIMIAKQMKSNPAPDTDASLFARLQWFMAVIGIVTAIACSLILINEVQPNDEKMKQSHFVNTSGSVVASEITSLKTLSVFSILAKF